MYSTHRSLIPLFLFTLLGFVSACRPSPAPLPSAAPPADPSNTGGPPTAPFEPAPLLTPSLPEGNLLLTTRQPSLEQLQRYFEGFDDPNLILDDSIRLEETARLIFEDLNGNREPDLIVEDRLQIRLLLWQGTRYGEPYSELRVSDHPEACSRILLEDWTGDRVPEVIFDYRGHQGTPEYPRLFWDRTVIHCPGEGCRQVWSGRLAEYGLDEYFGGLYRYDSSLQTEPAEVAGSRFSHHTGFFSVYSDDRYHPPEFTQAEPVISYLNVYTSTSTLYEWTGASFEPVEVTLEQPSYQLAGRSRLSADSPEGASAFILAELNGSRERANDLCTLYVDDRPAGDPFGCKRNFTTLSWEDLTGDGQAEIVIETLSGPDPLDRSGRVLEAIACPHQRLLIYGWEGNQLTLLADVTGCVADESLFGVRLQDVDGDGTVEILAVGTIFTEPDPLDEPDCWYELDREPDLLIYRWNGRTFTPWQNEP